jgi:hypothetical protein
MGKRIYKHESEVKSPPALKHGVFSAAKILPGEDPKEFAKLLADVRAELHPSGPIEDEHVLTIASVLWRKRRLAIFQKAARARRLYAPVFEHAHEPGWDEDSALMRHHMKRLKEFCEDSRVDLEEHESINLFNSGLNAAAESMSKLLGRSGKEVQEEERIYYALAKMGESATPEYLVKLLDLEERLDATLERAFKRLMQCKSLKAMVLGPEQPQLQIAAPKTGSNVEDN